MKGRGMVNARGWQVPQPQGRQSGKTLEERLGFSLGNRTRVAILAILNEGSYSVDRLAQMLGESYPSVKHHLKELLAAGAIEVAYETRVRNTIQLAYRAIEMPAFRDEEFAEMSPEERRALVGLTLQGMTAEAFASLGAGKMDADPRLWLAWRWFNVDEQGRNDLADEQARSWRRVQEIEAESLERRSQSGEEAQSIVITAGGFKRHRDSDAPPWCGTNSPVKPLA